MAIDAAIPLSVQYRPAEDIGTKALQMSQVADARAQALERIQQTRDTAAINAALQTSQGDPDAAADALDKSGSGTAAMLLRKQTDARRKSLTDNLKTQLDNTKSTLDIAGSLINSARENPDAYQPVRKALLGIAGSDPRTSQALAQLLPENPNPDHIPAILEHASTIGVSAQEQWKQHQEALDKWRAGDRRGSIAQALALAQTPEARTQVLGTYKAMGAPNDVLMPFAQAIAQNASADDIKALGGIKPKMTTVAPGGTLVNEETGQPVYTAPEKQTFEQSDFVYGNDLPLIRDNKGNFYDAATKEPVTKGIKLKPPAAVTTFNMLGPQSGSVDQPSELAKSIAAYQTPMPSPRSSSPAAMAEVNSILKQVRAINPSYDAKNYVQAQHFLNNSQAPLNALNTAIEHLDQFADVAAAMGNGSFRPGNAIFNWFKTTFGDSAPTNFDGMKNIMAGELAATFKKSGATDQEIANVQTSINRSASPQQLQDYITKIALPAIVSKAKTYDEQYHQMVGKSDPYTPYTPSALDAMERRGINPANPRVGDTSGEKRTAKLPNGQTVYDGQQVKQGGKVYTLHVDANGKVTSTGGG